MLLSDILEQLTAGELSQVAMGGYDSSIGMDECNYPRVIPHINLGLAELYKRFPINLEELTIIQQEDQKTYILDPKYAATNTESTEPIKYILDTPDNPFTRQPLRIESIFNEEGEETRYTEDDKATQEYLQSDREKYWMAFTPKYNTIYLPYPEAGKLVFVSYRSSPEKIETLELNPYTTEVDIPVALLEALLLFVAARVYSNLNSDNAVTEGNNYMQKFEMSCKEVSQSNLLNTYNNINNKLDVNQWV